MLVSDGLTRIIEHAICCGRIYREVAGAGHGAGHTAVLSNPANSVKNLVQGRPSRGTRDGSTSMVPRRWFHVEHRGGT